MGFQNLWSGQGGQLAAQMYMQPERDRAQQQDTFKTLVAAGPQLMQAQALNEYRRAQASKIAEEQKMKKQWMDHYMAGGGGQQQPQFAPQGMQQPQMGEMEPMSNGYPSAPGQMPTNMPMQAAAQQQSAAASGPNLMREPSMEDLAGLEMFGGVTNPAALANYILARNKQTQELYDQAQLGNTFTNRPGSSYYGMPASAVGNIAINKPNNLADIGKENDRQLFSQKVAEKPDEYHQLWEKVMNPNPKASEAAIAAFEKSGMTRQQAEEEFMKQSAINLANEAGKLDPQMGALVVRQLGDNPMKGLAELHKLASETYKNIQQADVVYPAQAQFYNSGIPLRQQQTALTKAKTDSEPIRAKATADNAATNRANSELRAQSTANAEAVKKANASIKSLETVKKEQIRMRGKATSLEEQKHLDKQIQATVDQQKQIQDSIAAGKPISFVAPTNDGEADAKLQKIEGLIKMLDGLDTAGTQ